MFKKLCNKFLKRKKTIPECNLTYTRNKLKHILYNDGKILDININERIIRIEKKIEYLIDKDYHIKILDELNGVLIVLIEECISDKGTLTQKAIDKIVSTLDKYEKFIDDLIEKCELENNKENQLKEEFINNQFDKFSEVVDSISEDIKKGRGSI